MSRMSKSKKLTSLTDKSFKWDEEPFEDSGFKGVNILAFGKEGPTYYQDPRPWDDSDPKHFDTLGKVVKGFKPGKFDIVVLEQGEIQRILEPKAFGTEKGVKQRKSTGAKTRKVGGPKKGFVQVIVKGDRGEVDQLIRRRVQEEVEIPTGKLADQMLPDISIPSP
ncbi:MAG TPA: hypothetical protein VN671_02180, partial [Solirubrobacterales bacterium]|nr:hypothetical protein [Solirubrobacterales bacterium]